MFIKPLSEDYSEDKEKCHSVQFSSNTQIKEAMNDLESPPDQKGQTEEQIPAKKLLCCSECGEGFSTSEDLSLHIKLHWRGELFSCSICNTSCSDRDSLIHHMRLHTRQTQFTCHLCGKDFAWRRHLTKHMEVHIKRKKVFHCRVCGAEFCTYYLLSKHKSVHQTSELPRGQTENNKEEMAASGDNAGGREPANTDSERLKETNVKVSTSFKTENNFWTESSKPVPILTPKGCNYASQTDENTMFNAKTWEVKREDSEPPQVKEEEEETEIGRFTFSPVPMKTEENEDEPQSFRLQPQTEEDKDCLEEEEQGKIEKTSEFCGSDTDDSECWTAKRKPGSGSNSESDSGRNQSSCSDNKPPESLQAESDDSVDSDFWKDYKKPQSSSTPTRQEPSEEGEEYTAHIMPYSCPHCSKAFRYSSYLKSHVARHAEKYFCSKCGYRTCFSSNLKSHLRTHTGEKPFGCLVCGKRYRKNDSLLSHMSVHDAERKYNCATCKKSFAWFTEFKYHQCFGESSGERSREDASINLKQHNLYS
ncbi:zinc finger protein 391 [Fundulus heteroclitus]|uniref:zinc finger protein 391 n=1 Tax=Fundulus heteroclitus TaxID=8078 RepID=UPI00165A8FBD|nr:zinc finger protein 391 [Fundulus heteroclitus]XP_036001330.1 zinc finger protein 391 [Fundulus heteroclitus]